MRNFISIFALLSFLFGPPTFGQTDSSIVDTTQFDHELRERIIAMFEFDQQLRIDWGKLNKEYGESSPQVDSIKQLVEEYRHIHADSLKSIFKKNGFPTHKEIGRDGVQGLFVMTAHTKDLKFQELCLIYFIIEAKNGGISWSELAILFDKIQVEKGEPQYFSTQLQETDDGSFKLYPIADEKNLDQRRQAFDMLPIREFLGQYGVDYVPTTEIEK